MFSASAIAAFMRKPYFIIPIIVFIYNNLGNRLTLRNIQKSILIIGVALLVLYLTNFYDYIYTRIIERGLDEKITQFPKLFIRSLLGVFPWNQIFHPVPSREILIQYMLQAPYNLTMIYFSFIFFLTHKVSRNVKSIFLYVILFFLSGVIAEENHVDYVSMAIPLLAIVVSRYSLTHVLTVYGFGICVFIIGSGLYTMLGFYGAGLFS
jgi:hypothetical protein